MSELHPSIPFAKRIPTTLTAHDDALIDDYYWLNDRENPEVIAYLNAENEYLNASLAHTKDLQEKLYAEIVGRIKQEDQSVPYFHHGYFYLTRYEEGGEYPIYARKKGSLEATEEVLLHVPTLAQGHGYFAIGSRSVSPNNRYLAYGEDTVSRRIYTIRFKDLETGELLPEVIENTNGSAIWSSENGYVFYTAKDPVTLRGYKIFRHQMGTSVADDVEVFHEECETFDAFVGKTKSEKYIAICSHQTISHEYQILEADKPLDAFKMFQPRERGLEHQIDHFEDRFYVLTNLEAQNFRLMVTLETATTKENWQEVIPHRADVLLEGMEIFKDYLVLSERKSGITQLRVRPWQGEEHYIQFPEAVYMAYVGTNLEFDTPYLRLGYQSLTTPSSVFDYHLENRKLNLLKQETVLGDFSSDNYQAERVYVTVRDGVKVPLSIVYRKGFKKDGSQPLLLYGYGSYGYSMDPFFSSGRLSLLDRGFVYVIAHIRGGEEMGRYWYEDGKLLKKKNTFNDFIDCAEYLLQEKYTSQDKLFAMGGSAGGLLMGAIVNQRPDLWKGIIAAVPFVDVITTMLDDSIPLTTFEYDEWGNPNDLEYYNYMKSYSPYDNVEAKDYPTMLITTGLHDSQVQYWEPAKWIAKLRVMKTDSNPLYLYTNMDAGHGGASGRFKRFKETALEYAFLLDLAGISE
jgi:oligopeptidase B